MCGDGTSWTKDAGPQPMNYNNTWTEEGDPLEHELMGVNQMPTYICIWFSKYRDIQPYVGRWSRLPNSSPKSRSIGCEIYPIAESKFAAIQKYMKAVGISPLFKLHSLIDCKWIAPDSGYQPLWLLAAYNVTGCESGLTISRWSYAPSQLRYECSLKIPLSENTIIPKTSNRRLGYTELQLAFFQP
ncbi:hypothetical protein CLF_103365 [Clonorchis sinensis]|uniref:Uncharacterized protein n=1 Tax=Clonorchis sinensis TaxID=79923 RepID=G7Y9M5_CLOSI|nr:hypothetical protein CLF_103365 [Clonorchis sinensis]